MNETKKYDYWSENLLNDILQYSLSVTQLGFLSKEKCYLIFNYINICQFLASSMKIISEVSQSCKFRSKNSFKSQNFFTPVLRDKNCLLHF